MSATLESLSLPSWERGLKSSLMLILLFLTWSLPSWERGLKFGTSIEYFMTRTCRSPRGSVDWNPKCFWTEYRQHESLPSWERGLKSLRMVFSLSYHSRSPRGSVDWNRNRSGILYQIGVAPLVGAWIEILTRSRNWSTLERRSPCGSDDWNRKDNRI